MEQSLATPRPSSPHLAVEPCRKPFTPINSLPLEVFYHIVPFITEQEQADGYYDRLRILRLVAATWSALIDGYPTFWTTINSSDPEEVWQMALKKSKAVELDVDCTSWTISRSERTRLVEGIVSHMPRIRTLRIPDPDFDYLVTNAPAAPRLQSLYVAMDPGQESFGPRDPAKWAPNIRELDLNRSSFIWTLEPFWSNLECLRINTGVLVPGLFMKQIFTILNATSKLRILDIRGTLIPTFSDHSSPLPVVKLEELESLTFHVMLQSSPFEALNSIIAFPTKRYRVDLGWDEETRRPENLRSLGRFATRISDGEAGKRLQLRGGTNANSLTLGEYNVHLQTLPNSPPLTEMMTLPHLLEGLPPQRCSEVTTVEMREVEPSSVLSLLPVIHSLCPNVSHLVIPDLTTDLESALGRPDETWLLPRLETLTISHYGDRNRAMAVTERRLKAFEAGEHVTKLKSLNIGLFHKENIDVMELAEVDAFFPKVLDEHLNTSQLSPDL